MEAQRMHPLDIQQLAIELARELRQIDRQREAEHYLVKNVSVEERKRLAREEMKREDKERKQRQCAARR